MEDKHIEELQDACGVNSLGECPTCGYVECSCQSDSGFDETKWCVNDGCKQPLPAQYPDYMECALCIIFGKPGIR